MTFETSTRAAWLAALLLGLTGCPPTDDDDSSDDDDSVGDDDDDSVGDDDDSTGPAPITVTGEVIARASESGGVLAGPEYTERSGLMVVYLLEDPSDLTSVLWKTTLSEPGTFGTPSLATTGPVWATVIADCDQNAIIEGIDIRRDYHANPVNLAPGNFDLVLEIDVPDDCRDNGGGGGGGGGGGDSTTISGPITLMNVGPAPIAVAAATVGGEQIGWWRTYDAGATSYSIDVATSAGEVDVIGYHDGDGNGLFEPSDNTGGVTSNPVILGIGDVTGAELLIPSGEPLDLPMPATPITLAGDVVHSGYTGGDILVRATAFDRNGQLFASQTLPGPGPFSLEVPSWTQNLVVWAVEDPDVNGTYDLNVDASDLVGPFATQSSDQIGVTLDLEAPPAGAGSISGTIAVLQSSGPQDRVVVMLMDSPDPGTPPMDALYFGNPGGSVEYSFEGLEPGTYLVRAWLDYDSDMSLDFFNPQPDEGTGGTNGLLLTAGTDMAGQDFDITEP